LIRWHLYLMETRVAHLHQTMYNCNITTRCCSMKGNLIAMLLKFAIWVETFSCNRNVLTLSNRKIQKSLRILSSFKILRKICKLQLWNLLDS
jgi:hypothetical protein